MYEKMLESEEALEILSKRPRINSNTVNLDKLKHLPDGTLGKLYSNFLLKNVNYKCNIKNLQINELSIILGGDARFEATRTFC